MGTDFAPSDMSVSGGWANCRHTLAMLDHDSRELAAIFVGGALGTVARAVLETLAAPDPVRLPWPTFTVNIVGAFLLGYFTTRLLERLPLSSYRRPLLGTGLCGGLTTFSTIHRVHPSCSFSSRVSSCDGLFSRESPRVVHCGI
jgi:hypothetical protein